MKAVIKKLLSLFLAFGICSGLVTGGTALAESSGKYIKKQDGGSGIEIGIGTDSMIVLDNENIAISFQKNGSDELLAIVDSEYNLTNNESRRAYASIAVVKKLRVEAVGVPGAEEELFVSGEKLSVNDKELNGFIYPIDTQEKIVKKSAYKKYSDVLYHMEFSGYFDEAFARYGVTSTEQHEKKLGEGLDGVPKRVEKQMWRVSETGEEKLCIMVYNLCFEPQESKLIKNTQKIQGSMERPTDISEKGTVFSFKYSGENLESFYNVKNIKASVNFDGVEEPESFKSEAPFYSDDGKPTLRFSGGDFRFEFSLGRELDKNEVYDIYAGEGYVRKILDAGAVIVTFIVVISAVFIVYSVKKRKKSGIGLSL